LTSRPGELTHLRADKLKLLVAHGPVRLAICRQNLLPAIIAGPKMENLTGKTILIVEGSSLAAEALRTAFIRSGARVYVTGKVLTAFDLVNRIHFDGAVVDCVLHNEAFELCEELRDLGVPYVCCNAPHRRQGMPARANDAAHAVWRLAHMLSRVDEDVSEQVPVGQTQRELRTQ